MLKIFNFLKSNTGQVQTVSLRQRFQTAQDEMNAVLGTLNGMPVVSIDTKAQTISFAAPEQFADEALALPAPDEEETTEIAESDGTADTGKVAKDDSK
jgi:hypothetical protein